MTCFVFSECISCQISAQLLRLNVQVDFEHLDVFGVEDVTDVGGGETRPQFLTCFNALVQPVMNIISKF